MNLNNKVAVLLAAYNGLDWISEQVFSILNQQNVDVHIYISVDLSSDATYKWCKEFESETSQVTVLSYGTQFGGAAKNFFRLIRDVDFSDYDYVSLSDQDDIWLENKLSHAVSTIKINGLDAFSSDVIAFWEDGSEKLVRKSYPQKRYDYYFEAAGPGCTYVFTQGTLQQFKLFLINHWQDVTNVSLHDWLLYSYYRSNKLKWYIDTVPLMRYRQHASNQVGFNYGFKAAMIRLAMVRNNWYAEQVNRINALVSLDAGPISKVSRLFLITHFWQLRRRPRDAFTLLIMLISGLY